MLFILLFIGASAQLCEDDWTGAGNYCYYVSEEVVAWNIAETKCQQMHGHLLSVENNDEYEKILEMRSFRNAYDFIWIGLHRLKTGSSNPNDFEYTDETPYTEIEFRPNGARKTSVWPDKEPSTKQGYDCARMKMVFGEQNTTSFGPGPLPDDVNRIKDGQWKMARCGSTTVPHKYACKKRYDVDPVLCLNGYKEGEGKCWKLGDGKLNFEDAKTSCRIDHQGHLAEINSPTEEDFITDLIRQQYPNENVWLGLEYSEDERAWVWSTTGGDLSYFQNWQTPPTSNSKGDRGYQLDALWYVQNEDQEAYPLCKKDQGKVCPPDWKMYQDTCYQWFDSAHMKRNWDSARMFCASIGANIAIVPNQAVQNFLSSFNHELAVAGMKDYWIGASNIDHRDYFAWVTGNRLQFNNFPGGQVPTPNQGWDECVAAAVSGNTDNWSGENCGEDKTFLCEVPTGNPIHEPADEDYKCDDNFHFFDGNGYCYHTSKTPHAWKGAGRYCSNLGAQLASIHDADENAFIGELVHLETLIGDSDFWLAMQVSKGEKRPGTSDYDGNIPNSWQDGTPVDYTNFADNKPEYLQKDKYKGDCVQMTGGNYTSRLQWMNKKCDSGDKKAICKMRSKNNPLPPDVPELPVDPNQEENVRFCGSELWRHYREDPNMPGRCYYFGTPRKEFQMSLKIACDDLGGKLVSVNSPSENNFITQVLSLAVGNCLDGGVEDERSNLCYYMGGVREDPNKIIGIKEYAVTWIEAESECEKLNGHLAEINDDRTWSFVKELPFLTLAKDLVWIGLYRNTTTRDLTWTTGDKLSSFRSNHWAAGQPIDRDKYDCVNLKLRDASNSIDRRNAAWSMDRCNRNFPYLCQAPADQVQKCPDKYVESGDYCWRVVEEELNYNDAQDFCYYDRGGIVAEAYNQGITNSMINAIELSTHIQNDEFWLGLCYSQDKDWSWYLSHANTASYSQWVMGEPSIKGSTDNCAVGEVSTAQTSIGWRATPIDVEKKFVCQIRQGRVCPGGWVMHGDKCFKWFIGGHFWRSWFGAHDYCAKIGAKLLVVKDPEIQHYIAAHHANLQRDGVSGYWLGARAEDAHGKDGFVWIDGYPLRYQEFSDKTDQVEGEECVMAATTDSHGNWEAVGCNQQHAFVCTVGVGGLIHIPEDDDYRCDEGWHYWQDDFTRKESCYKITRNPQPQLTAQRQCEKEDARLVSIENEAENDFVTTLMHASTLQGFSGDVWIGMKVEQDGRTENALIPGEWRDGTHVTFQNWAPGMPKYTGNRFEGDCVGMYGLDNTANVGKWANKNCLAIDKRGVCKKEAKYDPNAPTPPPIIIHPDEELNEKMCGSTDWAYVTETKKCYHFISAARSSIMQRGYCEDMGGTGVSVNSPDENEALRKILELDPSSTAYWTGGFDNGRSVGQNFPDELPGIIDRVGKWEWADGSAFSYINWASDEPDYDKPSIMCIQMLTSTGEWIGVDCGAPAYGICEKPSSEMIFAPDIPCTGPECCRGHIGAEYGGAIKDSAFTSNGNLMKTNSEGTVYQVGAPERARLNMAATLNISMTGWFASEGNHDPWLQVDFGLIHEIRGIVTQGGDYGNAMLTNTNLRYWTQEYTIQYKSGRDIYSDYKDATGAKIKFQANYDWRTPVQNLLPNTLVTSGVRIKPTKWKREVAALRVEFLGCKDECINSLGAALNPPYGVVALPDTSFDASSATPGFEASKGRLHYASQMLGGYGTVINVYQDTVPWDQAKSKCISRADGNGALVSIDSKETNSMIENKIRESGNTETCHWIGLTRVNGQFEWDDGSPLDYTNWADGELQQNKCVCMDPTKYYTWVTQSCDTQLPHVCEKYTPADVWVAAQNDNNQWLQVDLLNMTTVSGIEVQGNPDESTVDYVTAYQVSYSANGVDFVRYKEPHITFPGDYYPTFVGPSSPARTQSAYFQHPITARYIRLHPTSWVGRVAMRVDILGCADHTHIECTSTGDYVFSDLGSDGQFTIACPAGCASNDFEINVIGTTQYALDSSVCQAAIHDGRLFGENGGVVKGYESRSGANGFTGSIQHGVTSTERVTNAPQDAFIFQSDHLGCEDGWRMYREYCYFIPRHDVEDDLNWYKAREACQAKNADLTSLADRAEFDFVFSYIKDSKVDHDVFIGLTDAEHHSYYDKYIDGTKVTFTNWSFKEPNSGSENEFCVKIYRTTGLWDDTLCTKSNGRVSYVCKKAKVPVNDNKPNPSDEGCPTGWTGRNKKCYKLFNDPKTWGMSVKQCKGQGATLATVHDDDTNKWLNSFISEEKGDKHNYWIGLYADRADDDHDHGRIDGLPGVEYHWDSGEVVDYTDPWLPGEPGLSDRCANPFKFHGDDYYECINKGIPGQLLGQGDEPGYWCGTDYEGRKWIPCDTTGHYKLACTMMIKGSGAWHYPQNDDEQRGCFEYGNYVCEKMKEGEVRPVPQPSPPSTVACYEALGWYGWPGSKYCYKMDQTFENGNEAKHSFDSADKQCKAYNDKGKSSLVSIHSQGDNDRLVSLLREKTESTVWWIGLHEAEGVQGYGWTDGSAVNFLNWDVNEPNDHNGMEKCAELKLTDEESMWNDNFCWSTNHFICKLPRGETANDVKPSPPPSLTPDQRCQLDEYYDMDFYSQDGQVCEGLFTVPYSWQNGENFCQEKTNGHMTAIHSQDELAFTLDVIRTGSVSLPGDVKKIWIGLSEASMTAQWMWADGSPTDFTNWAGQQPNNDNGAKLCAEMDINSGLMTAQSCQVERHIICQWRTDGKPIEPPVEEDYPAGGGCPDDGTWYRYRNRCFQYNGLENGSSNRKTWYDAETECSKKGATLASIYDDFYNSFISSHLFLGPSKNVWIGMHIDTHNFASWTDEKKVTYTNFNAAEGSAPDACVSMKYHGDYAKWSPGHWTVTDSCTKKLPYVCQLPVAATYPDNPNQAPASECPTGYYPFSSSCYKMMTTADTQDNAHKKCGQDAAGRPSYAGLATVWNEHEGQFLQAMMYEQPTSWLGMTYKHDLERNFTEFIWEDNFPILYVAWDVQQPAIPANELGCVTVSKSGLWSVEEQCTKPLPFMCKIETKSSPGGGGGDLGEAKCDPGWSLFAGANNIARCYRGYLDAADFGEASRTCADHFAYLASIHSELELKFAQSISGHTNTRLGGVLETGTFPGSMGGWGWIDESAFDFSAWAEDEPSGPDDEEQCMEMWTNGLWNDNSCSKSLPFICAKPAEHSFCNVPEIDRKYCVDPHVSITEQECLAIECCFDITTDACYQADSTYECLDAGGKCVDSSVQSCNRGIITNDDDDQICPDRKVCCLDCQTPDCKIEDDEWKVEDVDCVSVGGVCQFNSLKCELSKYSYYSKDKCGGPQDRECCRNPSSGSSTEKPTTPIPTVSVGPTDAPPSSSNTAAIVGGVIGGIALVAIVSGAAFYFGKNKSSAPIVPMMSVRNPSIRPDVEYADDDDDEDGGSDHDYMGQSNPMYAKDTAQEM